MTFQADAFQDNYQREAGIYVFPPATVFSVRPAVRVFVVKAEDRVFRVEPPRPEGGNVV